MPALARDPLGLAIVAGAALLLVLAVVLLVWILRRLRLAFAEELHTLPGGRWWQRFAHRVNFGLRVGLHVAVLIVLLVYAVIAVRFLWGVVR